MTHVPADDFRAIVSQVHADFAQPYVGPLEPTSSSDCGLKFIGWPAASPRPSTDLRWVLLEARANPIQVTAPAASIRRLVNAATTRSLFPGWDPRHVPHESVFPPPFEKVAAGGPRLNRRARRRAAHRRGSSS